MTYTSQEITRIDFSKTAEQGKYYFEDNGNVWVGLYSKGLKLYSTNPALPVDAARESTSVTIDQELNTQTIVLDSIVTELQLKANLNEIQPVSIQSSELPVGASTEAKQDISNLNQYTQLELLNLIFEELQQQTKLLKKIYQ